jgi:hypothetical protein
MNIENVQTWLHDPKFNHIKYVAIRTLVMLTENINISKGTKWNYCYNNLS